MHTSTAGVALWVILLIMVICSMRWVRECGNFEVCTSCLCCILHSIFATNTSYILFPLTPCLVFYWTNFLYLVFWLLAVFHAPDFWRWFIGPFCLFAMEKIVSLYKSHSEEGKSFVTTGVVLPSNVSPSSPWLQLAVVAVS